MYSEISGREIFAIIVVVWLEIVLNGYKIYIDKIAGRNVKLLLYQQQNRINTEVEYKSREEPVAIKKGNFDTCSFTSRNHIAKTVNKTDLIAHSNYDW